MSWQWKMMQNLKRNWLLYSRFIWGIWGILNQELKNLKNLHLNGLLLTKVYNVCTKQVQSSYIWQNWILMENWKEKWPVLSKMTMRHYNEKLCKIWRGLELSVQNWHEEFEEFWPRNSKISNICALIGCFCPKYIMFKLKMYRGVICDSTEYWCKFWKKKNWLVLSKMT